MANEKNSDAELKAVALELFKASRVAGVSAQQIATRCFKDASAFLEVSTKVLSGSVDIFAEDNNPLDEAFAPNLKKTHPINLMSREWGSLEKVREVLSDLDQNPKLESYEKYGWGLPEVNQARMLFPAKLAKAKLASTK